MASTRPTLLAALIARAVALGIPVFIDPGRITEYARYRGADLLVPNRGEAEMATARKIQTAQNALAAAQALRDYVGCGAVIVKDRAGMVLATDPGARRVYPTQPREVYDVTGAGDMVLAVIGLCRAAGVDWNNAVPLANLAAGLEVEKLGVAALTRAEIRLASMSGVAPQKMVTLDEMESLANAYRRQGKKLVFTNGCFDLLHVGHVNTLQEATRLGDLLIVAVNSDASVRLKARTVP
jgi:D-beta-D-heptose 7-phosphate kinase/D-beta-D-heptose 1-phosphate adenosyltransferase